MVNYSHGYLELNMGLRGILDYLASPPQGSVTRPPVARPNLRWIGCGSEVHAGVFHLFEPLVYVYDSRRGRCDEPAAIDISLPISSTTIPPCGRELPYWPTYQGLAPHQRRFFLQWLAGNRSSITPELGYTFLFFYNLERRALIDRSDVGPVFT